MEVFGLFWDGLLGALTPMNLLAAVAGCFLGMIVGVLPGVGPLAAIALLLPITAGMGPAASLIMFAAIYYGSMYGGTITSVLLNVPGEAASVVTTFDGYQMARQGKAGKALGIAAIGSFIGGIVGMVGLIFLALPLTAIAVTFGPVERFTLLILALATLVSLSGKSIIAGLMMAILGVIFGMVGMDPVVGAPRFTFGSLDLLAGLDLVPVVVGLFGLSEVLYNLGRPTAGAMQMGKLGFGNLFPNREEWKRSALPIVRGTGIGFVIGLIPGMNSALAAFLSYSAESRHAKQPLGTGAIEGVAAPETANNAYTSGAMIPLLTLGIPSSPVMALLLGAFLMNGIIPGPRLFTDHSSLVWVLIASLLVGNVILLIMNLPLIGAWIQILRVPYPVLTVTIIVLTIIGSYSINNSIFDVGVMVVFGFIGYAFKRLDLPMAPLILGFVLGPLLEQGFRTALELSNGDYSIIVETPLSIGILLASAGILVFGVIARRRRALPVTDDAEV